MLLASSGASAEALRRVPLYRMGSEVGYLSRVVVRNVYGPASSPPEIVACSNSGGAYALTYSGPSSYRTVWYSQPVLCGALAVGDLDGDGRNEVVMAATEYGKMEALQVYDPEGFGGPRASVQIPSALPILSIAIGNADADPGLEIVVATRSDTYIYDAATLSLEWTATGRGGAFVAIADLENDGVPEIILNGAGDGQVLNGVTHAFKWGYSGGFGGYVAVGDVDGDGKAEIVGSDAGNIRVFQGDTLTSSSFGTDASSIAAIAVGDANGDGQSEIIVSDIYYRTPVSGYSATGTKLWAITSTNSDALNLAVGDVDGDRSAEVVWSSNSYNPAVYVGRPATNSVEMAAADVVGAFQPVIADLNGDGRHEMIMTVAVNGGRTPNRVEIHDLAGGVSWFSTFVNSYSSNPAKVAVGQLDADPALEIAVLQDSRLYVYDGVTHALEWTSAAANFSSSFLMVRNVDSDPMDEIIVATTDNKVEVLDGASPFVQNISPALDYPITDVAVADLDGDQTLDYVVASFYDIYVFKASDFTERLHMPAPYTDAVAATEGEFAVASTNGGVTSYSGTTLQPQWTCYTDPRTVLRYGILGGKKWLAAAAPDNVQLFATGGTSCPDKAAAEYAFPGASILQLADMNGDGAAEMILAGSSSAEVDLIALASAPRGDADNDGVVADTDMDTLARYFFGDGKVPAAGADVNGDLSLRADDLLYLINYRRGTGAAPPQ
ncbi:MAG: VCBS repeat-containing protein [Acidobacteria bacterium]|nr:VCBS repeat-containing protein [Acidobacteriota bacterium]